MARQQQYQGQGGVVDPIAARQKEEQRRRQQAYAQALAQQVQQRELQKQRDRDIERQGTSHGRPGPGQGHGHQGFHDPGGEAVGKGLFDGFGEKGNQNRTNFARGQRQPLPQPQHQEPQQISPMRFENAPQGFQPEFPYSNNGFHPQQQQQQQYGGGNGFNPDFGHQGHGNPPQMFPSQQQAGLSDWGAPLQPQPVGFHGNEHSVHLQQHQQYQQEERFAQHFDQHQQHFNQQPQYQELPSQPQQHGRGLRADPSSGGFGALGVPGGGAGGDDESKARRKLQQQMEIQSALQKQVEEKNRLKLEAKRRQEEEDRREVERFEAEQRRLKQEEARIKDEKRKKAEEELVRAQQAAAALADHQKKAQHHLQNQQQQQVHHQQEQASPQRAMHNPQASPMHRQQQHPQQQLHNRKSPQKLDPFANTRAHLFEDPPVVSPQRRMMQNVVNQFNSHADDERPLDNEAHKRNKGFRPQVHHHDPEEENEQEMPMRRSLHRQPESFPKLQHRNEPAVVAEHSQWPPPQPQFVDPTMLLRQYDEMKQELMRQRQMVDQLREAHAQIQLQQQQQQSSGSPSPNGSTPTPTLSDLEQLRNELREELLQREQLHRQELEKFRRQQEQPRSVNLQPQSSSREALGSSSSRFVPNNQHSPPSYATKSNHEAELRRPEPGAQGGNLNHSTSGNSRSREFQGNVSQERELDSTFSQVVLNTSPQQQLVMPTASLQCDSKMVYFDGQVRQEEPQQLTHRHRLEAQAPSPPSVSRKPAIGQPPELVSQLDLARSVVDPKQRASVVVNCNSQAHKLGGNNQDDSSFSRRETHAPDLSDDDDDGEDSLAFFIKDFREPKSPLTRPNQRSALENRLVDGARARVSGRYSSWMRDDLDDNDEDFVSTAVWKASSRLRSRAPRPHRTLEIDEEHDDSEDDDEHELSGSVSLSGEELEAIFQRNVRRHEILLSFQPQRTNPQRNSSDSRSQGSTTAGRSMAWTQLHHQLEENVAATSVIDKKPQSRSQSHKQVPSNKRLQPEDSLIASSRWMPSTI